MFLQKNAYMVVILVTAKVKVTYNYMRYICILLIFDSKILFKLPITFYLLISKSV